MIEEKNLKTTPPPLHDSVSFISLGGLEERHSKYVRI